SEQFVEYRWPEGRAPGTGVDSNGFRTAAERPDTTPDRDCVCRSRARARYLGPHHRPREADGRVHQEVAERDDHRSNQGTATAASAAAAEEDRRAAKDPGA